MDCIDLDQELGIKRPEKSFESFEWMVKFTRQREWIEGRGLLLLMAFFFGFGAGLYLVSLYFNSLWGLSIAWFVVTFGFGGFHFIYLGRPLRAWRAVLRPQTSWISRGIILALAMILIGGVQIILLKYRPEADGQVLKIFAGLLAFLVCIYTGFVMNYVRAIPFWNNPLLPIIIVAAELLGGLAAALSIGMIVDDAIDVRTVESWSRILLTFYAVLLVVYLLSLTYGPAAGREAVRLLISGKPSYYIPFWIGLVIIGILLPLILAWYPFLLDTEIGHKWLFVAITCDVVNGLAIRYVTLKGGIYAPLIPVRG